MRTCGGWALVLAVACGPGIRAAGELPSEPLLTIHGRLNSTDEEIASFLAQLGSSVVAGGSPRVALVWAGRPKYLYECSLLPAVSTLRASCPPSDLVASSATEASVTIGSDGSFDLPVWDPPPLRLTEGTTRSRLAYGSIVAYLPQDPARTAFLPDSVILASSFPSASVEHRRIAYREGDPIDEQTIYPLPACPAAPRGFSVIAVGEENGPGRSCAIQSVDTELALSLLDPGMSAALGCVWEDAGGVQEFAASEVDSQFRFEPPASETLYCVDANTFVQVLGRGPCARVQMVTLLGCRRPPCVTADIDETASPPVWWPC